MSTVRSSRAPIRPHLFFQMLLVFRLVMFLPCNDLSANSGWHEEAFPTTISYASMTDQERVEAELLDAPPDIGLFGNDSSIDFAANLNGHSVVIFTKIESRVESRLLSVSPSVG